MLGTGDLAGCVRRVAMSVEGGSIRCAYTRRSAAADLDEYTGAWDGTGETRTLRMTNKNEQ